MNSQQIQTLMNEQLEQLTALEHRARKAGQMEAYTTLFNQIQSLPTSIPASEQEGFNSHMPLAHIARGLACLKEDIRDNEGFMGYDEDGDVVMTDAATGQPLRYSNSQEDPAVRNLTEVFARMSLEEGVPPPAGEPEEPEAGWALQDEHSESWCLSALVPDLSLRLDMRHPRVLLNFLRFVHTYNELAPEGEEIHLPPISTAIAEAIRTHPGIENAPPEYEEETGELRYLLAANTCRCPECV